MLRLGSKYMVSQLVDEGKLHIKLAFPKTIEEIDDIQSGACIRMRFRTEDAISMVEIAQTIDIPGFYERALYHCCLSLLPTPTLVARERFHQ